MKYAWAENDTIRDVCQGATPAECYTPEIAAHYSTEVPDDIVNGATWDGSRWVNPAPAPAPEPGPTPVPTYRTVLSPLEFKIMFTAAERVAIKNAAATDPIVEDFLEILNDLRLKEVILTLQANIDAINYLVSKSLLTAERGADILQGMPDA